MSNGGRALIVENYSDLLMVISTTMKRRGYDCDAVRDADDAIRSLAGNRYSSILLDVNWPVTTNPVLRFLAEHQPSELRKVIIMTAFDSDYLGMEELKEICTFLKKPFSLDDLFARLDHCAPGAG